MAHIKITMKDGTIHEFQHQGRAGGSYTKELHYEIGFVVVVDEWGKTTAFPSSDVAKVETRPNRRW